MSRQTDVDHTDRGVCPCSDHSDTHHGVRHHVPLREDQTVAARHEIRDPRRSEYPHKHTADTHRKFHVDEESGKRSDLFTTHIIIIRVRYRNQDLTRAPIKL